MQLKPALVQVMQPNTSVSSAVTRRQSASAAALPSASSKAIIQQVSQNVNLTAASRKQVVEMAARVDQSNLPTTETANLFSELSTMAVYIPEGESPKIPDWSHLTGLRFYNGINAGSSHAESFEQLSQAISRLKENLSVQNVQPQQQAVVQQPVVQEQPQQPVQQAAVAPVAQPVETPKIEAPVQKAEPTPTKTVQPVKVDIEV